MPAVSANAHPAALPPGARGERLHEALQGGRRAFDGDGPRPPQAPDVPAAPAAPAASADFTDQVRVSPKLIAAIDATKSTLDISLHGISLRDVAEALLRAKNRGVRVRIVMNHSHVYPEKRSHFRADEVQFLIDNGFEMRTLKGAGPYGTNHNKFAVFDGGLLMTGSFNWSNAADTLNFENVLWLRDAARIAGFESYWGWMWEQAAPLGGKQKPARGRPPQDALRAVRFHGEGFPAYAFSPKGTVEQELARAVDLAESDIALGMFSFTSSVLQQALLRAKERGVRVRIVFDRAQARNLPQMRWFSEQGFDVKLANGLDGARGVHHHKFAVFDGSLLETGSFNWTGNAQENNYENASFFDDASLVTEYLAAFDRVWERSARPTAEDLTPPAALPEDFEFH